MATNQSELLKKLRRLGLPTGDQVAPPPPTDQNQPAPLPDWMQTQGAGPTPPAPPPPLPERAAVDQTQFTSALPDTSTLMPREAETFARIGQLDALNRTVAKAPPALRPKVEKITNQTADEINAQISAPGSPSYDQVTAQQKQTSQSLKSRLATLAPKQQPQPKPQTSTTPGGSLSRMAMAEQENEALLRDQAPPSSNDLALQQRANAAYNELVSRAIRPIDRASLPSKDIFVSKYIAEQPAKDVAARDQAGLRLPRATTPALNMPGYDLGQQTPPVVQNPQTARVQAKLPEFAREPYDPTLYERKLAESQAEFQRQPEYKQQAQKILTGIQQGYGQWSADAVATLEKIGSLGYFNTVAQARLDDRSRQIAMDAATQGPSTTRDVAKLLSGTVPYAVTSFAGPVAGSVKLGHILAIGGVSAIGEDWRDPERAITSTVINTAIGAVLAHVSPAVESAAVGGGAKALPLLQGAFDRQTALTIAAAGATIGASAAEASIGAGLFAGAAYAQGERDPYKLKLAAIFGAAFPIASGLKGLVKLGMTAKQQIGDIAPDYGLFGAATDPDFWRNYREDLPPGARTAEPTIGSAYGASIPGFEGETTAGGPLPPGTTKTLGSGEGELQSPDYKPEGFGPGSPKTLGPIEGEPPSDRPPLGEGAAPISAQTGGTQAGQVRGVGNGSQMSAVRTPQETPPVEANGTESSPEAPQTLLGRLKALVGLSPTKPATEPAGTANGVVTDPATARASMQKQLVIAAATKPATAADQIVAAAQVSGQQPAANGQPQGTLDEAAKQQLTTAQKLYGQALNIIGQDQGYVQELALTPDQPRPLVDLATEIKAKLNAIGQILNPPKPTEAKKTPEQKEAERVQNYDTAQALVDKSKNAGFTAAQAGQTQTAIKHYRDARTAMGELVRHVPPGAAGVEKRTALKQAIEHLGEHISDLEKTLKPQNGGKSASSARYSSQQPELGIVNPEGGIPQAEERPVDFGRMAPEEAAMEKGEKLSLADFIRQGIERHGERIPGIRITDNDSGELARLKEMIATKPFKRKILNEHPQAATLDDWRQYAIENGYLPAYNDFGEESSINDLLALLDDAENVFPVTGQTGNRIEEDGLTEGERLLEHARMDPEVEAAYQKLVADPFDPDAYADLRGLTVGGRLRVPRETLQEMVQHLREQAAPAQPTEMADEDINTFFDEFREAEVPEDKIAKQERIAEALIKLGENRSANALLHQARAGDDEAAENYTAIAERYGIPTDTIEAILSTQPAPAVSARRVQATPSPEVGQVSGQGEGSNQEPPATSGRPAVGETERVSGRSEQQPAAAGEPSVGGAERATGLTEQDRALLRQQPRAIKDEDYLDYLHTLERVRNDEIAGRVEFTQDQRAYFYGTPDEKWTDGLLKRAYDEYKYRRATNHPEWEPLFKASPYIQHGYEKLVKGTRDEIAKLRSMNIESAEAKPLVESLRNFAEANRINPKHVEALLDDIRNEQLSQPTKTVARNATSNEEAKQATPAESTPVEKPGSIIEPNNEPTAGGGLFGNIAPKTPEEMGVPDLNTVKTTIPTETTLKAQTIRDLIPFNILGNKTALMSGVLGRVMSRAGRTARRTLDAFGGSGTYTQFLHQRGYGHPGDKLNEFDPMRYITHYQIQQNPQEVIAEVKRIMSALKPIYANYLTEEGQTWNASHKKAQAELNAWFQREAERQMVPGQDLRQLWQNRMPVEMQNSPRTAALYYVMQSQMYGARPIQAEPTRDGTLAPLIGSNAEIGIIAPTKEEVTFFTQGNRRLNNPSPFITGASHRLKGVDVTRGDGWRLIREEAGKGDLVPVDTSYLNQPGKSATENYNRFTLEDADPNVWKRKVEENLLPAWDRGARLVITNNWDPKVAEYLQGQGFDLYVDHREGARKDEESAAEIIALNFDPSSLAVKPRRSSVGAEPRAAVEAGRSEINHEPGTRHPDESQSEPVAGGTEGESGTPPRPAREREKVAKPLKEGERWNGQKPVVLYHGTSQQIESFGKGLTYLSPSPEESVPFAVNYGLSEVKAPQVLEVTARPGQIKNINAEVEDALMNDYDVEATIKSLAEKARKSGYRYVSFEHPGVASDEFTAYVSLYPQEDLEINKHLPKPAREREAGRMPVNRTAPPFYSQLEKTVTEKIADKATDPQQMLATIRNSGVKEGEIKWTDVETFLRSKIAAGEKVTKQELQQYIRENNAEVQQVMKGGKNEPSLSDPAIAGDIRIMEQNNWTVEQDPDQGVMLAFADPESGDFLMAEDIAALVDEEPALKPVAEAARRIEDYWDSRSPEALVRNREKTRQEYEALLPTAQEILADHDDLGYANPETALNAVLNDPHFAQRWDIRDRNDIDQLNELRAAHKRMKDAAFAAYDANSLTKYSQYVQPGGNEGSYREMLITLAPQTEPLKLRPLPEGWSIVSNGKYRSKTGQIIEVGRTGYEYGVIDENHLDEDSRPMLISAGATAENAVRYAMTGKHESDAYNEPHWPGQPNVVAHLRADERPHSDGTTGLVIDETQSEWAKEGRKKGFKLPEAEFKEQRDRLNNQIQIAEANFIEAELRLDNIEKEAIQLAKDIRSKMPAYTVEDKDGNVVWQGDDHKEAFIKKHETGPRASLIERDLQPIEVTPRLKELYKQARELRPQKYKLNDAYQGLMDERRALVETQRTGVPDLPFAKTWPQLTVKAALRYAAKRGIDRLSIMPARVHIERWGTERAAWKKTEKSPDKWGVEYETQDGLEHEMYDTKKEAQDRADQINKEEDYRATTYVEPGRPKGYLLEFKAQEGGHAGGIDLEAEGAARGLINPASATFVTSLSGVKDAIHDSGQATGDVEGIANKVWSHMQEKDEGQVWPRAEGLLAHYGDQADYIAKRFPNRPDLMKYAWDRPGGKSEARMALAMRDVAKKWKAEVGQKQIRTGEPTVTNKTRIASDGVRYWVEDEGRVASPLFDSAIEAMDFEAEAKKGGLPVLSTDITPEMKRSVLQEGQPLFERAKWDVPQMYGGQNEADIFSHVRAQYHPHKGGKRQGVLWINEQAAWAIDQAMSKLEGMPEDEGGGFAGLSLHKGWANRVTAKLEAMGNEKWWNDEAKAQMKALGMQIQKAAGDLPRGSTNISFSRIDQVKPETNLDPGQLGRRTAIHERGIHASQAELGGGHVEMATSNTDWLDQYPALRTSVAVELQMKGYSRDQVAPEVISHLAQGRDEELGITSEEGDKLLASYFKQIYDEHGMAGLAVFEKNLPGYRAKQHIKGAKPNAAGQTDHPGSAGQIQGEARAAERAASSERTRSDLRQGVGANEESLAGSESGRQAPRETARGTRSERGIIDLGAKLEHEPAPARERTSEEEVKDAADFFNDLAKKVIKDKTIKDEHVARLLDAINEGIQAHAAGDEKAVLKAKMKAVQAWNLTGQHTKPHEKFMGFMMANLLSGLSTITKPGIASSFHTLNLGLAKFVSAPVDYLIGKAWGNIPGQRTVAMPKVSDAMASARAYVGGIADAVTKVRTGASQVEIEKGAHLFSMPEVGGNDLLAMYQRTVSRLHAAVHIPAYNAAYTLALMGQARLYGSKFPLKQQKSAMEQFVAKPSAIAHAIASEEAAVATLYNKNPWDEGIKEYFSKLAKKKVYGATVAQTAYRYASPFARVGFNKTARYFDFTGISLLPAVKHAMNEYQESGKPTALEAQAGGPPKKKGLSEKTQKNVAEKAGRFGIGAFYLLGGIALAAAGLIGSREKKKKAQRASDALGQKPLTTEIGDHFVNLAGVEPFGAILLTGAEIYHALHGEKEATPTEKMMAVGKALLIEGVARPVMETPPGQAWTEMGKMAESGGYRTGVSGQAARFIPGPIRDAAALLDRREKAPQTPMEAIEANVPGLSRKVPSRLDALGREHNMPFPGDPFRSTAKTPYPGLEDIQQTGAGLPYPSREKGESGEDFNSRVRSQAHLNRNAIDRLNSNETFKQLDPQTRKSIYDRLLTKPAEVRAEKLSEQSRDTEVTLEAQRHYAHQIIVSQPDYRALRPRDQREVMKVVDDFIGKHRARAAGGQAGERPAQIADPGELRRVITDAMMRAGELKR